MASAHCPCIQVRSGVVIVTGCIYTAVQSPVFFGAPFGVLIAELYGDDRPLSILLWMVAFMVGVGRLYIGVHENIRDGHGAPVASSLLWIAVFATSLHFGSAMIPDLTADRLILRGFCIAFIAGNAANLGMAFIAQIRRMPRPTRLAWSPATLDSLPDRKRADHAGRTDRKR